MARRARRRCEDGLFDEIQKSPPYCRVIMNTCFTIRYSSGSTTPTASTECGASDGGADVPAHRLITFCAYLDTHEQEHAI